MVTVAYYPCKHPYMVIRSHARQGSTGSSRLQSEDHVLHRDERYIASCGCIIFVFIPNGSLYIHHRFCSNSNHCTLNHELHEPSNPWPLIRPSSPLHPYRRRFRLFASVREGHLVTGEMPSSWTSKEVQLYTCHAGSQSLHLSSLKFKYMKNLILFAT